MELVERQVLRRKGPLWREIMSTDPQLLRQCQDQGLLSSTEVKNIKNESDASSQYLKLVTYLENNGPTSFDKICYMLVQADLSWVADEMVAEVQAERKQLPLDNYVVKEAEMVARKLFSCTQTQQNMPEVMSCLAVRYQIAKQAWKRQTLRIEKSQKRERNYFQKKMIAVVEDVSEVIELMKPPASAGRTDPRGGAKHSTERVSQSPSKLSDTHQNGYEGSSSNDEADTDGDDNDHCANNNASQNNVKRRTNKDRSHAPHRGDGGPRRRPTVSTGRSRLSDSSGQLSKIDQRGSEHSNSPDEDYTDVTDACDNRSKKQQNGKRKSKKDTAKVSQMGDDKPLATTGKVSQSPDQLKNINQHEYESSCSPDVSYRDDHDPDVTDNKITNQIRDKKRTKKNTIETSHGRDDSEIDSVNMTKLKENTNEARSEQVNCIIRSISERRRQVLEDEVFSSDSKESSVIDGPIDNATLKDGDSRDDETRTNKNQAPGIQEVLLGLKRKISSVKKVVSELTKETEHYKEDQVKCLDLLGEDQTSQEQLNTVLTRHLEKLNQMLGDSKQQANNSKQITYSLDGQIKELRRENRKEMHLRQTEVENLRQVVREKDHSLRNMKEHLNNNIKSESTTKAQVDYWRQRCEMLEKTRRLGYYFNTWTYNGSEKNPHCYACHVTEKEAKSASGGFHQHQKRPEPAKAASTPERKPLLLAPAAPKSEKPVDVCQSVVSFRKLYTTLPSPPKPSGQVVASYKRNPMDKSITLPVIYSQKGCCHCCTSCYKNDEQSLKSATVKQLFND